jgi:hypothetical protein
VLGDCDLDGIPDFEDPDFHLCDQETCKANYSRDLELGVQDIFDFLNAYFAGLPCADFNESGTVTVQDIFDFLAAWFSHPAGQLCDPNHAPAC